MGWISLKAKIAIAGAATAAFFESVWYAFGTPH